MMASGSNEKVQEQIVAGVGTPTLANPRGSPMHCRHRRLRRPAANEPGHVHELTFSCFRGYSFLKAERTCQWLADALHAARAECNFALWAYVFMPSHGHLLIYPKEPDYSIRAILKAIKQPVGVQAI